MIKANGQNCNLIANGGFENGAACGIMPPVGATIGAMNNWVSHSGTPDILSATPCSTNGNIFELNSGNSWGSNLGTIVGLSQGNTGNFVVGFHCTTENEAIRQTLAGSFKNGSTYEIKFSAKLGNVSNLYSGGDVSGKIAFYSSTNTNIPVGNPTVNLSQVLSITPLTNIEINTLPYFANNPWKKYSTTFVYAGATGQNVLYVSGVPLTGQVGNYIYLDDISLIETPNLLNTITNVCVGSTINLMTTYSSAVATYSWTGPNNFSSNLQNPTIPNATVANSGIYTCNITGMPPNSCTSSATVNITVGTCNPCINTSLATPITGTGANNTIINAYNSPFKIYKIEQDVTIDGPVNFDNSEIIIAPNVKITVLPTGTLSMNGTHVHSCSSMWKGIDVQAGGRVDLSTKNHHLTNIIEDAEIAVNFNFPTGKTDYTDYLLMTGCTIFNRNKVGVKISNYQVDSKSNDVFPFKFSNCAFTSRNLNLPSPIPSTNTSSAVYPTMYYNAFLFNGTPYNGVVDAPLTLSSPLVSNQLYPDNVAEAYLKTTTPNQKPDAGIVLENVALQQLDGAIEIGFVYGGNNSFFPNLFDNLNVGIDASASNLNVQSCVFQKAPLLPAAKGINLKNGSLNKSRIGLAKTQEYLGTTLVYTSNTFNAFYDLPTAIQSNGYNDLDINNNIIRSSRSNLGTSPNGQNGIVATSDGFSSLKILDNEFTNLNTGMLITDKALNSVQATGVIEINKNTIQPTHPAITSIGNESSNNGIVINGGTITNNTINDVALNCNDNKLNKVSCGITIRALNNKDFNITNNTISVANSTTITGSKYGIALFSGSPDISGIVENNKITGTCSTIACNQSGIYLEKQLNTEVGCNEIGLPNNINSGLTNGFRFVGVNNGTKFFDNMMHLGNKYGFTLENGGIIGQQGSDRTPGNTDGCLSNNSWGATVSTWNKLSGFHRMTNNINSDPKQSPLYVYDNIWTRPEGSGAALNITDLPYQESDGSLVKLLYNDPPSPNCTRCTWGSTVQMLGRKRRNRDLITLQIADGTIDVPIYDKEQMLYVLQEQLYKDLKTDEALVAEYPELQTFMDDKSWGSFDFIYYTPKYLAQGDANAVDILLNYFPSDNQVDDNYWLYYNWINEMRNNPTYQPPITDVFNLANQCPALHGTVVYAAQNLYMQLTNEVYNFENVCESLPAARQAKKEKRIVATAKLSAEILIYPNPSKGMVHIKLPMFTSGQWNVSVTDMYGKTIINKHLVNSDTEVNMGATKGLYIVKVTNTQTGENIVNKIIVN
jgi:hypothetical protein